MGNACLKTVLVGRALMPDFCLTAGFVGHKCPTYSMCVAQATLAFYPLAAFKAV